MDQLTPIILQAQQKLLEIVDKLSPEALKLQNLAFETVAPLLPYYQQAQLVVQQGLGIINPYVAQTKLHLAPVGVALLYAQSFLPEFKGVPVNYVGIAVILIHVLLYKFIAVLEFKTKIFTKIFRGLAIYLNIIVLIVSALIRDSYLQKAILADQNSRVLFSDITALNISTTLLTLGIFLNLWVLSSLGLKGMYNGASFGVKTKEIKDGAFYFFDDPQYFGTTLCLLGYAVKYQSRIGYGLTGVMYLAFSASVLLIEAPHFKAILAKEVKAEKQKPKKEKAKARKNN